MGNDLTCSNFKKEVIESKLPCLVIFCENNNNSCKMIISYLKEIAEEYRDTLKIFGANVEKAINLCVAFKACNMPTLIMFKNGTIIDKVIGKIPKNDLQNIIKSYI